MFVPQKAVLSGNIVTGMTDNPAFTDPEPPLADVTAKKVAMEAKYAEVQAADANCAMLRVELKQLEYEHDVALTALCTYGQNACGNDPAVLASANIPLAATPTPVGILPAPANVRARTLQAQKSKISWSRPRGAASFIGECAQSADGPYTQIYVGTKASMVSEDETPGTLYWFRVAAVGAAGRSDWSDPISKRAV